MAGLDSDCDGTVLIFCVVFDLGGHNKGRHTLEMKTNGTWHDIPNTTI